MQQAAETGECATVMSALNMSALNLDKPRLKHTCKPIQTGHSPNSRNITILHARKITKWSQTTKMLVCQFRA